MHDTVDANSHVRLLKEGTALYSAALLAFMGRLSATGRLNSEGSSNAAVMEDAKESARKNPCPGD